MIANAILNSLLEADVDDPQMILRSQPRFRFITSSFEGEQVICIDSEHDETLSIGNVVQGPENRWYVVHARGLRNADYNWGVTGQSYDTKEKAAIAIWTRQFERVGHLPDRKYKRYR
jgi:hypothetical protein